MSSYFQSSSSSGGSPYFGGGGSSGVASSGGKRSGVVGFAENLGGDIAHSIVGIPNGLLQTAEHPIRTAKQIGQSYAQTYGPLTHGDVGKFLHNVYEHPLGPALDLATVLSLGATGLERLGVAPEVAKSVELRSPAALAGQNLKDVIPRPITGGPLQRAVKIQAHHLLNQLPVNSYFGETARFGRELEHLPRRESLAARTALRAYTRATKNLSNEEFAALHLIGRGIHPQDYLSYLKARGSVEPAMLKVLDNPKINQLVESPTPKVLKAVAAAKTLSEQDAALKIGRGLLEPEAAAARITKHSDAVANALGKDIPAGTVEPYVGQGHEATGSIPDLARERGFLYHRTYLSKFSDIRQHGLRALEPNGDVPGVYFGNEPLVARGLSWKTEDNVYLRVPRDKVHDLEERAMGESFSRTAVPPSDLEYLGKDGKWHPVTSRREAAPLRPVPGDRFYVPDVLPGDRVANADFAKMGGGFGVTKLPGSLKANQGILVRTGRLALAPDLLGPEYLKTIKYGLFDDIHSSLMEHAIRLDEDHLRTIGLPKGYVLLRKKIISKTGNPRPQQIGTMLKASGDIKRGMEDLVGETPDRFTADTLEEAQRVHGQYLAVPDRLAKNLAGEFKRSNEAVRLFLEKPTKVWRALVLGLRVGFLTNNVVGNHLLFALHAAGPEGLRAYLNAVRRVKGANTVKTLLADKQLPPALRQQFMDEFFPEHVEGTFGKAQKPTGVVSKRLDKTRPGRAAQRAALGFAPATQAIAEGNLRRALVEYYIRKDPQWRAVYRAMPRQTRDFEVAAKKLLANPSSDLQRRVSLQVNQALGDYLNLGPMAQVARGIFPFAAWYKAILHITGHLALDAPERADLLQKLGEVGANDTAKYLAEAFGGAQNVPNYLLGLLPLSDKTVATTSGINPFQTVTQLGTGAVGLLTGKPGATGRAFANLGPNPILLAAMQNLAGKDFFTGRDLKGGGGFPGQVIQQVATQLPQAQLGKAVFGHGKVTKTYGQQTGKEAVLQFLGLPVKPRPGSVG